MNRRDFVTAGLAAISTATFMRSESRADGSSAKRRFTLNYAPHFGTFRHSAGADLIDQIKFMADQGFTALEDNPMRGRPQDVQKKIRKEMDRHGMQMGVFQMSVDFANPTFTSGRQDLQDQVLTDVRESIEVAKRMNAKWCTVIPGKQDHRLPLGYQRANCIELLRRCAELCEPHKLVMVLEPINHFANAPETFLFKIPQAYALCKAVKSPSCKILFDIYHQQISEGNLIPNIDSAWDEIAYFQIGDNPGRKEPGTGEVNYRNIFQHIHRKGYTGLLGMEHGNAKFGKAGEQAVLEAYSAHDPQ